jgi:hypothetical protein
MTAGKSVKSWFKTNNSAEEILNDPEAIIDKTKSHLQ